MADKKNTGASQMGDLVSQVTVKALQEFDSGNIEDGKKPGSRPSSAGQGSVASSKKGSRPSSGAIKTPPRTGSAHDERPSSAISGSAASKKSSRPASGQQNEEGLVVSGSRPGSAASTKLQADNPALDKVERPLSGRPRSAASQPTSAAGSRMSAERPSSGRPASAARSGRPGSGKSGPDRPGSGRPGSGRPESGRAKSEKPGSDRPESGRPGSDRPESGRPGSERPGSGRPGSDRPESGRPGSHESGSGRPSPDRPGSDKPGSDRARSGRLGSEIDEGETTDRHASDDIEGEDGVSQPPTRQAEGARAPPQTREAHMAMQHTRQNDMLVQGQTTGVGGDGGDGGDSDEDEDEQEEEERELEGVEEESTDESDGDGEMVVLDPDHPLMKRFQKALKQHLAKQCEKVTLEMRELLEATKTGKKDREDVGVELYGVQQELARHQMLLEKNHDDFSHMKQSRLQTDQELTDIRHQYKDQQFGVNDEKKKGSELQAEVENLSLRIFYMETAKEDVRSDIAVMKRAAEKAESEVMKAESDKQKQDLFVDRLVERVDKLREEISMYEAQLSAQGDETKSAKEALTEAHMEIEAINLEKKQLYQQWNSSLIGMRRRDEAHSAMMEALHQQQQRILSLETEIEGYKKSISKEQEQNEKLTVILSKTDQDIVTVKKMLTQCQAKHDALKNEYATYTRMLHETEQALSRATTDKTLRLNELNALRKQIEREFMEKIKLEDEILEKLRSQLTMDKAAQYTDKLTSKVRERTREMEAQVAVVENDISKDQLEISHTATRVESLKRILKDLDDEIRQKNEIISRSEAEITKRNAVIERKQGIIDQYNKKLELMISQAGGVELGPLEIQINSLQKSIDAEQQEITELQQMWLRNQSELVHLSKEKDEQTRDVENLKKRLTILSQKKLRIEGEIDLQKCETTDIERNIRNMQNDMLKLNMLLHKEHGMETNLEQSNILMENDFVGNLKEAEMESIVMQQKLESMKEEKERLLNSLVEAERQIMLWEKKTQLARETRAAVDSEIGQGEVRAMKAEIHRMQVRYTQLMKQQERMIQEMEKAVSRRDTIVNRGDAQSKANGKANQKVLTKGTFQRQMGELRKKIKQTIQDANTSDGEIRALHEHQQELSMQLEERQLNVQQLQGNTDSLDGDIDRLLEIKQRNMADLVAKQQRAKNYQQLKDKKYTRLCRTDTALDNELQKQIDRMQALTAIVDRLNQEFPHVHPVLRKATLAFGSRGSSD